MYRKGEAVSAEKTLVHFLGNAWFISTDRISEEHEGSILIQWWTVKPNDAILFILRKYIRICKIALLDRSCNEYIYIYIYLPFDQFDVTDYYSDLSKCSWLISLFFSLTLSSHSGIICSCFKSSWSIFHT